MTTHPELAGWDPESWKFLLGFRGLGFRVLGFGFRVLGVYGLGFRVLGVRV